MKKIFLISCLIKFNVYICVMEYTEKINQLIEMLNENNKIPYSYFNEDEIGDLIIFSVKNKNEDFLFNILDLKGDTPKEMSVNWRSISHIKSDLIEYNNSKIKTMPKLSKPKSFSVSSEIVEVDFKGTICETANLLKSGIVNQTIVLVSHNDKWNEINVLNLGGDDSNLQAFKNFIETMKLGLSDLGIVAEKTIKTSTVLTHDDFMMLSEKYPVADYIQISLLNDYNVKSGGKSSIDVLTDDLKVITRDNITVDRYIFRRENDKKELLNKIKSKTMEIQENQIQELEVKIDGQTVIPVEAIQVHEAVVLPAESVMHGTNQETEKPATTAKKPISIQVFETLTPERISELQGLNERQLQIVKDNPVIAITDKKTYEEAKKTAAVLLKASTAIDGSAGIEATAAKYLNTFKSMLKNALQPIAKLTRDPYNEQKTIISTWENAELLRNQAIEREKLQRIKKRTDELFAVPFTFNGSIYSIGTVYCTPSQVETATDEDFKTIVDNGKTIKQALDAELEIQAGKDKEIAELKAKLAALTQLSEISNTEPEIPASIHNSVGPQSASMNQVTKNSILGQTETEKPAYILPSIENTLLNALDLKNVEHLEKPAYIKCRGFYVQGLIDTAKEIEFILNDNLPNAVKKSERIANLCEILKKSV